MLGQYPVLLAGALLCALAIACGGDGEGHATPSATVASPAAVASAAASVIPTAATVTRTEVITYAPPASASTQITGTCFGASVAVQRLGAWRCMALSQIHDPCFGLPTATTVICVRNPTKPEEAAQINLLSRACEDPIGSTLCAVTELPPSGRNLPWTIETARGSVCTLQQGTLSERNGEIIHYGCSDGVTVLGEPAEGVVWTVRVVTGQSPSATPETVPLLRVWR